MNKYYVVTRSESGTGFTMHTITAKPYGGRGQIRVVGDMPRCLGYRVTILKSRVSETPEQALEKYKNQAIELLERKNDEQKSALAIYEGIMSITVADFSNGG